MNSRRSLSVGVVDENKARKKRVASSFVDFFRTRVRSPPPPPRPKRSPGPLRAPVVVAGGSAACLAAAFLASGVFGGARRSQSLRGKAFSIPDAACGGGGDRTAGCRVPRGSALSIPPGERAFPRDPSLGACSLRLRCGVRVVAGARSARALAPSRLARSRRARSLRLSHARSSGNEDEKNTKRDVVVPLSVPLARPERFERPTLRFVV